MVEMWEEEGQQDSEWRDGLDDEIGSGSVLESIRNCPMYSPPRSLTDWCADQVQSPPQRSLTDWCAGHVQSPPLDLFGLQFGYEAYLPPATTTVCNIEASLLFSSLKVLYLRAVSFSPLPESIGKLSRLETLYISGHDNRSIEVNVKSVLKILKHQTSIDKPINAQAISLFHSALYSQACKLNFVGAQATRIYLTVQCFIEKESNAKGFFLEGRYVEDYHRSDIKYFYQSIKKFMRWLDSSEEKMFGGLGVKYIEQKVESAEKSCITISHLKGKSTTERPKRKYRTVYLITLDDLCQLFGHKRADAAKTLGGCWIGAEMNHIVQFLKVEESNAQFILDNSPSFPDLLNRYVEKSVGREEL